MPKRLEIKVSAVIPEGADAFIESDLISASKEAVTKLKEDLNNANAGDISVEVKVVSPPEKRAARKPRDVTTARTVRAAN